MNIKVHSIEEVAKLHKRTPKGIKMRLQKIILYKIYNDLLDCNEIKKYIKCTLKHTKKAFLILSKRITLFLENIFQVG